LKAQAWAVIATTFMSSNFEVLWKAITGDPTIWSTFVVACWSLGVEEQFYIIMPFIAGFIMKMKSSD
jgi:peptidoglycan/LPS O-acetylase OafA/YrhL